jgi:argonaute-like protein implicated in RNA metabolism and viral defense
LESNIASQVIYEDTVSLLQQNNGNTRHILNNLIPGILAKLGNLPFILAEPLPIADYFIGLDISRKPLKNRSGSRNVCAVVRVYNNRGEFIRYNFQDSTIEGEEIDRNTLYKLLPKSTELKDKKLLIYRDGKFRGDEVENLLKRANSIGSEFILVECIKSGNPRLYSYDSGSKILSNPKKGMYFISDNQEVVLISSEPIDSQRFTNPIRLKVISQPGQDINLHQLVETTLKLTLLHHGSLRSPRLPIPLFGADKIAYRRIQGVTPSLLDSDRQFWL